MCGICGIFNIKAPKELKYSQFRQSLLTMKHRGPDGQGIKQFDNEAILGHLRLSIIDLSEESNQPFERNNRYWITFNGEIFNYIEIKNELKLLGYTFKTQSDTEVLLVAYEHWGEECVKHFNGMWAFAILDKVENKLFCSRDRFGIKPFNYTIVKDQFFFSSEIKAIISYFPELKIPNYNVIANYCRTSVGAQLKETWFENIFRLAPAHNLVIKDSEVKIYRYWDYPKKVEKNISFQEAISQYRNLLKDSLNLRMRSDVPVGFTLSSGIDSTSLVCMLKGELENNKNTYTASFAGAKYSSSEKKQNFKKCEEIDEPQLVRQLASELEMVPNFIEVNFENTIDDLKEIVFHLESGHGSPAIFPLNQVLQRATKDVTVVLEGQGADELLGGYISNTMPVYILELIKKRQFKLAYKELKAFAKVYSLLTAFKLFIRQSNLGMVKRLYFFVSKKENFFLGKLKDYTAIKDYPKEPKGFDNLLNQHLFKAHTGGLVNLLHYGDALSMSHSLESRLPFMDYRLVEYVFSLPSSFKIKNGFGKYLHRQAMKGIVPDYIINNPIKFGFDTPLAEIFSKTGTNSPTEILLSEKCINRGLFSKPALIKALEEQKSNKKDSSRILFRLLSVELWFRAFIDK